MIFNPDNFERLRLEKTIGSLRFVLKKVIIGITGKEPVVRYYISLYDESQKDKDEVNNPDYRRACERFDDLQDAKEYYDKFN